MPEFDPITLTTFMAASIAPNLTPGADMMFISASGAAGGSRVGIAAAMGVSIGSLFHTVLAVVGVAALIKASPAAYDVLRYVGAAYLVYLAITTWRAGPPDAETAGARNVWRLPSCPCHHCAGYRAEAGSSGNIL